MWLNTAAASARQVLAIAPPPLRSEANYAAQWRVRSVPESRGCDLRALYQRSQFAECDLAIHPAGGADRCREPTIRPGDHPLAPDNVGKAADALGDQLGVLDVVGAGIDHTGDQDLVVRQFRIAPHGPFMFVTRIGSFERDRLWLGLQDDRQDLLQRNV